jgi:two-component system sensor histidine kinase UhpB
VGRLAAMRLFTKVLVANGLIVLVGALAGTLLTAHIIRLHPEGSGAELVVLFGIAGFALSVAVNWVVLRVALRPLESIIHTVEQVRLGNFDARAESGLITDPQIETLRETINDTLNRLAQDRARVRAMSSQIITAQEEERLRIARELHDETAQALASLLVRQRVAERSADTETLHRTMTDLRALTSDALEGVRRLAFELRPTTLDDLGLVAALDASARQFAHRTGLQVDVRSACGVNRLPKETELVIYRVVQEALSNVARHSDAEHVWVELSVTDPYHVSVVVRDDGRGFDPSAVMDSRTRSLGLFGMRERAALVEGDLAITSVPGGGTTVRLTVPRAGGPS